MVELRSVCCNFIDQCANEQLEYCADLKASGGTMAMGDDELEEILPDRFERLEL